MCVCVCVCMCVCVCLCGGHAYVSSERVQPTAIVIEPCACVYSMQPQFKPGVSLLCGLKETSVQDYKMAIEKVWDEFQSFPDHGPGFAARRRAWFKLLSTLGHISFPGHGSGITENASPLHWTVERYTDSVVLLHPRPSPCLQVYTDHDVFPPPPPCGTGQPASAAP